MSFRLVNQSTAFAFNPGDSAHARLWHKHKVGFNPCVSGTGTNIVDLSPSKYAFARTGAAGTSVVVSPIGPGTVYAANTGHRQTAASWGLPCKFMTTANEDELTVQAVFKFNHSAVAKESVIFESDTRTLGANVPRGYKLMVDNNADKVQLMCANTPDELLTFPCYYKSVALTPGQWYHVVFSFGGFLGQSIEDDATTFAYLWLDGVRAYPTIVGTEQNVTHVASKHATIGATFGSTAPDISVAQVNVWNRFLRVGEIALLHRDPLAMFRRRRLVLGMVPAAGGRLISIGGTALRGTNLRVAG